MPAAVGGFEITLNGVGLRDFVSVQYSVVSVRSLQSAVWCSVQSYRADSVVDEVSQSVIVGKLVGQ